MTYIEETRDRLTDSIDSEAPIRFAYIKRNAPLPQYRVLSVYELSEDGETFLGFDHGRQELRRFDVTRVVGEIEFAEDEDYIRPIEKEDT